jgi:hypothetical protein
MIIESSVAEEGLSRDARVLVVIGTKGDFLIESRLTAEIFV